MGMSEVTAEVAGEEIVFGRRMADRHREASKICPQCNGDCYATALIDLAYLFRVCSCGDPDYPHLVEQLWHLACLQGRSPDVDSAARSVLYHLENPRAHGRRQSIGRLRAALEERGTGA